MSTHPDPRQWNARVSEETARRLLARAIEIDSRRSAETSLTDLWHVAEEAGISRTAFEMALRELAEKEAFSVPAFDDGVHGVPPNRFRRIATPLNAAMLAVVLFVLAAAATFRLVPIRSDAAVTTVDVEVRAEPGRDYQRDTAHSAP